MFLLALSLNAVGCFPTCLQLELERMRCQEVAAARADLQQQLGELQRMPELLLLLLLLPILLLLLQRSLPWFACLLLQLPE